MPELPDVTLYIDALERFVVGRTLLAVDLRSPFVVRTLQPALSTTEQQTIRGIRRLGKRIIWQFDNELFVVFHLMIAGRFHWRKTGSRPRAKTDLIAFQFEHGTLMFTEASPKKRAALYVVKGEDQLAAHDPGGLEVLDCTRSEFAERLLRENHTLKRSLTDPHLFSGIGNSYSDEILHAARLSPLKWTSRLTGDEIAQLYDATRATLVLWIERLRAETGDAFPEKVTAFRAGMAVHGRFRQPCPVCATPVQRIVYAENETNYCPTCQTEGKLLADRSLSKLLKDDWPKTIDEW